MISAPKLRAKLLAECDDGELVRTRRGPHSVLGIITSRGDWRDGNRSSAKFIIELEVDDTRPMTTRALQPQEKGLSYGTDYYVEAVNLRPIEPYMEYGDNDFGAAGAMVVWGDTPSIRVLPPDAPRPDPRTPALYFRIDNGTTDTHRFSEAEPAFAIFDWRIRILSPLDNVEPPVFAFSVALPDLR